MASPFSHAVAALSVGACFYRPQIPKRVWVAGMVCYVLPDLDVIEFRFGIHYGDFWATVEKNLMALSPPKASRTGLLARQAAKRDTSASTLIHPIVTVCTRWIRRIASGQAVCSTEANPQHHALYLLASRSQSPTPYPWSEPYAAEIPRPDSPFCGVSINVFYIGMLMTTVIPARSERISNDPPNSRIRSRIPARPTPALAAPSMRLLNRFCGIPRPSSLISNRSCFAFKLRQTSTAEQPECR